MQTAPTIVTNTNQPIVLSNTDAEISVIMVLLRVIGRAYCITGNRRGAARSAVGGWGLGVDKDCSMAT